MLHFSFHDASRWAVRSCGMSMSVSEGDRLYLVLSAVMHDEHGDLHQRTRSPHVPSCSFSHNSLIPGVGVGLILLRQEAYRAREAGPAISKPPNLLVDLDHLRTTWKAIKSPKRGAYGLWLCPPK